MKQCSICGSVWNENELPDAAICPRCGTPFDEEIAEPAPDPAPEEISEPSAPEKTTEEAPPAEEEKPVSKKKNNRLVLAAVFFVLILVILGAFCFLAGLWLGKQQGADESASSQTISETASADAEGYYYPQGVSAAEFSRLSLGMTYSQISAILGGDAYQATLPDASGSYSAVWPGENDVEAALTVRFVNGQAAELIPVGLE